MDSFEFNKIAGAVLGAALFALLVSTLSDILFASHPPETPFYLASLTSDESDDSGLSGAEKTEDSIAVLLASADAAKGEKVAKKCVACHTFDNGGAHKTGPNLWDIVNRNVANVDGFQYSASLATMGGDGKVWDYESLDLFLRKPKDFASGTKMAFGGISKADDRAHLVAYLRSLSDSPAPLPEAGEQADAGSDAAAETQTAAAAPADQASDASTAEAAPAATTEAPASSSAEGDDTKTDMAAAPASETSADQPADAGTMTETAAAAAEPESAPSADAPAAGRDGHCGGHAGNRNCERIGN